MRNPGTIIYDPGYTGGSLSLERALGFAHITFNSDQTKRVFHIHEIYVPAGTKGFNLDYNRRTSHEAEIVLRRGTYFKVGKQGRWKSGHPAWPIIHLTHLRVIRQN
jgi:hypothetical protein